MHCIQGSSSSLIQGAEEGTEMTLADLQHCVKNILSIGLRTMK